MTGDEGGTGYSGMTPRGAMRLAFARKFGALFWGRVLGGVGFWIQAVVAAVVVYAATSSALWVGLVSIVQGGAQLILTPLSGRWADTGNPGRQIMLGRLLGVIGSGGLAAFCALRGDLEGRSDAMVVLVASLVVGLGTGVGIPAEYAVIPHLIRRGELPVAMSLNSLPLTVSRVLGPVGGAYVAAEFGAAAAFGLAALAQSSMVLLSLMARWPSKLKLERGADYRVRAALSYVRRTRTVLVLLVVVAAVGFGSEPSLTLAPTIADELGGSTQLVGQLTGAFGLGAFLGFIGYRVLSWLMRQPKVLQVGLLAMVIGTALLAVAPSAAAAMAAFGVAGVGFMVSNTATATLVQQRVPASLRGRVMALWVVGFAGSRPLASAVQGYLADSVSLVVALLATAAVLLAAFIAYRPGRRRDTDDGPE